MARTRPREARYASLLVALLGYLVYLGWLGLARSFIEQGKVPARITDLHVWRVGRAKYAVVLSLTTSSQKDGDYFRQELAVHEELAHVTVEVDHVPA